MSRFRMVSARVFAPLLAGASLRDRAVACLGALLGIGLVGTICLVIFPASPWLIAPIGASAVLLFAVPASPLAQPWPIMGGNLVSAVTGIFVVHLVHEPAVAAGLAVGAAILVMSLARCLHPPGGAAALSAVLGAASFSAGPVTGLLVPLAVNSVLLVGAGWAFHRFSGHSYPHRPVPVQSHPLPADPRPGILLDDIDRALEDLGETFDIGRDDLALLLARAEAHAEARRG